VQTAGVGGAGGLPGVIDLPTLIDSTSSGPLSPPRSVMLIGAVLFSGDNTVITDPVGALNKMQDAEKALQLAVQTENDAVRGFVEDVKEFGQDTFREEIGTIKFNELMRLARM
jgi:hypothetical protein